MRVPMLWLARYVDLEGYSAESLRDMLTLRGLEIGSIERLGEDIEKVMVGRVTSIAKHQDSDHLLICQIDVGTDELIQVVTGAPNLTQGDLIPVALHGAHLPGGVKIKKGKLRGVESQGMLCSGQELHLKDEDYLGAEVNGILILREDYALGMDIKEALQLSDTVLEAEPTPNRPDLQSIFGVAREVAAAIDRPLLWPDCEIKQTGQSDIREKVRVEVQEKALCPRYMARSVIDITIEASPMWMRRLLRAAGQRPINNIVDITNFVMIELGQPMHAFDLRCVQDEHIIVRCSRAGESFVTLDGKRRDLPVNTLMITDPQKSVGIAGVMGGENSEITANTQTALFESAKFNGASIRKSVKAMGMASEAASRFIKGIDIETTAFALERACHLVEALGAGVVECGLIDVCDNDVLARKKITVRPESVNALLSLDVPAEEMQRILNRLDIPTKTVQHDGKSLLKVEIPHFRDDIEGEADIAEEVARVRSHQSIQPTLMKGDLMRGRLTQRQSWTDQMRMCLVGMGMYEALTYSFTGSTVYDKLELAADSSKRESVKLLNPFGEDNSLMRTTLITGMLPAIATNAKRLNQDFRFFELGNVHSPAERLDSEGLPREKQMLCLGLFGEQESFYTLKGAFEELGKALDVFGLTYKAGGETYFHPGRKAQIFCDGEEIGQMGEIHPKVAENFEIPGRAYIAEVDVEKLFAARTIEKRYQPLARFPAISRDLALLVPKHLESAMLAELMKTAAGSLLESVMLFDIYEGDRLQEGLKSLAYTLRFRASDRTLTDEEIARSIAEVLQALKEMYNVELRS